MKALHIVLAAALLGGMAGLILPANAATPAAHPQAASEKAEQAKTADLNRQSLQSVESGNPAFASATQAAPVATRGHSGSRVAVKKPRRNATRKRSL
jgi:hypothetical protein